MNIYQVFLKERKDPITINAESVVWHISDSTRNPLPVKKVSFMVGDKEIATVLIDQLQAYSAL